MTRSKLILRTCVCLMECFWVCSLCEFACCLPHICIAVISGLKYSIAVFPHHLLKYPLLNWLGLKRKRIYFFLEHVRKMSEICQWWKYWIFTWPFLMSRYLHVRYIPNLWMEAYMSSVFSKTQKFSCPFMVSCWLGN